MINYSDRASELGGIVNLVDRRQSTFLEREAVSRTPSVERASVERRVSAAPVSRAPQLIITN